MAATKPKLQGYVEQRLYDRFAQWKEEQGFKGDSESLNKLLEQFFNMPSPQVPSDEGQLRQLVEQLIDEKVPSFEDIQIAIQQELWSDSKRGFIEGLRAEAQSIISAKVAENQVYWDSIAASGERMKEAIARIEARLQALEGSSNPSGNLSSNPPPDQLKLKQSELARRLGIDASPLLRYRKRNPPEKFREWSAKRDPDGIAWEWNEAIERFIQVGGWRLKVGG